ncbi:DUF3037 family protein [Williamsia muralis]|uniref:DUF3037 family protein n=1 Tax=Williamsia marianensis TaxID=85044 RepID=A0A495K6G9_WILMA|nr:DUF3037 domain-containing protein [Williamsia muralis]RKR96218.1 DUF3037 family protein [Williamsia muralis]
MPRYEYAVVRCVPEPRTGEFVNVGAVAGSAEEGDWDVRQIQNPRRAAKLCSAEQLAVVAEFIAQLSSDIEESSESLIELPTDWLSSLRAERRNIIQLSEPGVAVADSAASVLDVVFKRLLVDIEATTRNSISKRTLLAHLRRSFGSFVPGIHVVERPDLVVGDRIRTRVDFAVGNTPELLTQAWSFQRDNVGEVVSDVKAWGYAMDRFRSGRQGAILVPPGEAQGFSVEPDIDVQVLFAKPQTDRQVEAFEEAAEVFTQLGVGYTSNEQQLADHARRLVGAA